MTRSVGIQALAVGLPGLVRTNAFWRRSHPEVVADAEGRALARLWERSEGPAPNLFVQEMRPYLSDPFRGALERRILREDEKVLDIELEAAAGALEAGEVERDEVDLVIVSSFLADQIGVGNAPRVAEALGLRCAAWNLETACSGSVVGLQTACGLVRGGAYRRVLVVASCSYSRAVDERDTLSWFLGDGAGAFVVGEVEGGLGFLGGHSVHTASTCGTFSFVLRHDERTEGPAVRMVASAQTGRVLAETATEYVRTCCLGAARAAGVALSDIDFFVFHTPVPWFARFAAHALEIDPGRTVCTNRWFGNIGPALMPINLLYAARQGRIRHGDLVLLQSIGSASSAAAAVLRWNEPALGPLPQGID